MEIRGGCLAEARVGETTTLPVSAIVEILRRLDSLAWGEKLADVQVRGVGLIVKKRALKCRTFADVRDKDQGSAVLQLILTTEPTPELVRGASVLFSGCAYCTRTGTISVLCDSISVCGEFAPVEVGVGSHQVVCRHWRRQGECAAGANCLFAHHFASCADERRANNAIRKQREMFNREHADDPHCEDGKHSKALRARILAEWIVATFGQAARGCIVDVAGGKGHLAAALSALAAEKCVVVDPAPLRLGKRQANLLESGKVMSLQAEFNLGNRAVREWVESSDLIVGLHPDQATEPLVDAALRSNKPFAVVPCCVFANLFPDRRNADNTPVVSYHDFIAYLQAKHQGVKVEWLPFKGKNRVLYRV